MSSVEMSLDEIIALQRKQKQSTGKRNNNTRGRGNARGNNNNNNRKPARNYVDHDAPKGGHVVLGGGPPNKMVRVNITNLACTVTSADLEELFANYNVDVATVHYNEHGMSVGTGDLHLRKRDAVRVLKDFAGVALDGQVLKMFLVDGSQDLGNRLDFSSRTRGIQKRDNGSNRGGNRKRVGNGQQRGGNAGGRRKENRPKKTEEQLDAELDAYMNKPKN